MGGIHQLFTALSNGVGKVWSEGTNACQQTLRARRRPSSGRSSLERPDWFISATVFAYR
jgi:hypothetical protein